MGLKLLGELKFSWIPGFFLNPFPNNAEFSQPWKKKPFVNIVRKGEKLAPSIFYFSYTVFYSSREKLHNSCYIETCLQLLSILTWLKFCPPVNGYIPSNTIPDNPEF